MKQYNDIFAVIFTSSPEYYLMPEVMFMKTRRSVIFDDELTERIQNFANSSGYILN